MTQPTEKPVTLRDRVAAYFLQHPHEWIDGHRLFTAGGSYAWRSRISECRTELGMDIKNRKRTEHKASGEAFTISEYCFVPRAALDSERTRA